MQNYAKDQARKAKLAALRDMTAAKINVGYLIHEQDVCFLIGIEKPDFRRFNGCTIM